MAHIGIVGAGPAGLTAAIAARQAGFDVTVFEQAKELRSSGVGITIAANGVSVLGASAWATRHDGSSYEVLQAAA
jgi:2-polyprenyl-6-methoxyphenol hydroxylase-like FAD-dependent oxidoreductase